ncbi:hypothetical protein [Sphingobacterium olei]|uniref:hypothetical protein n=1 Tax=Sphingobacterium olei TaxID=2571155 RepID=UPI001390561C|nr:hypothetical protein [Sphingobacterium olei]
MIFSDVRTTTIPLVVQEDEVEQNAEGNRLVLQVNLVDGESQGEKIWVMRRALQLI